MSNKPRDLDWSDVEADAERDPNRVDALPPFLPSGFESEDGKPTLQDAYDGSYYFIAGAGGDLGEWIAGYEDLLRQEGILGDEPMHWYRTNGAAVNRFAGEGNSNPFQDDLTCLLFSLKGLNAGGLAIFKLKMRDRWFDDVIDNMR